MNDLHGLVQEDDVGHWIALQTEDLLEGVHLDATVCHFFDEALQATPERSGPLGGSDVGWFSPDPGLVQETLPY